MFRCTVLGPLVTRELKHGDLKREIHNLARHHYTFPDGERKKIGEKTLESWYYRHRRGGIDALVPKLRSDRGASKISVEIQEDIIAAKREKPHRSIDQLILLMEQRGRVARDALSRSSVHRLLRSNGISRPSGAACEPEEYRSYEAEFAGDIWVGDVMHGPRVMVNGKLGKAYLISWMDDASRLLTHSAFYGGERAVDVESSLKQALLKRGIPKKIIVDNGSGYRTQSLKEITLRLGAHLIKCRPYAPEGKGKLERWHRTVRAQFLKEMDLTEVYDLADLNGRLWGWIDQIYHQRPHAGLNGVTPLARYQQDLARVRTLGERASRLDEIFYHRLTRKVRKDGTISYLSNRFEVPYELSGKSVRLVVDPHTEQAISIEDEKGEYLGSVTPEDKHANVNRKRRKPAPLDGGNPVQVATVDKSVIPGGENLVEIAYKKQGGQ
ncbi:MAG: DDE-type integrase/transposase/recombinase [Gammaproteobacteria bacterium]|nr:DDE-type integrase/transposase/recombinase [Gammaproteobacteria bacterium]MBT5635523.1 DDE-type integrase/transposase/recombinase [Gammaproteobacteria bacterium]